MMAEDEETAINHKKPKYRVFFIRNGQTDFRRLHLFSGWCDTYLSLEGMQEAHEASQEFINSGFDTFDVVFTSNLIRGRKFGEIILKDLGLRDITTYHSCRLNERHHGWLTGTRSIDVACKYGTQQSVHWYLSNSTNLKIKRNHEFYASIIQSAKKYQCYNDTSIPESESIESCAQRILPYWENFIGPFIRQNKRVLIVVHEHAFRGFVKIIQKIDEKDLMHVKLPSATIPIYYDVNDDLIALDDMTFICSNEKKQAWLAKRWLNRSHNMEELTTSASNKSRNVLF